MNSASPDAPPPRFGKTFVRPCAWLTLVVVAAFPFFAWFGQVNFGRNGVCSAAIAAGICWLGAAIALAIAARTAGTNNAVTGVLLGMLFRMGIPLAAGFVLRDNVPSLAAAGVLGMVLCYYFVTLAVETLLSVRMIAPAAKPTLSTEHRTPNTKVTEAV